MDTTWYYTNLCFMMLYRLCSFSETSRGMLRRTIFFCTALAHCTSPTDDTKCKLFIVCGMFVANWFINVYYLWSSSSLKCCQTFWEVRIPLLVWGLASVISLGRLALPDSEVLVVPGWSTNHFEFQWLAIWSICDAALSNKWCNARFAKAVAGRLADLSDEVRKAALEAWPCLKR